MPFKIVNIGFLVGLLLLAGSCTREREELGTESNPIKLFFVPSVDVKVIEDSSQKIKKYLEANTPYKFQVAIPSSFVAVVESLGTQRADIAAMNTFGYILANERYGAQARITVLRHGSPTYQAQFLAREDSDLEKIEDLEGKKVAFVDPASTSGYLLPLKVLRERKIKPSETMFAMRHDSVVSMIYQGQVDAGATFHSPEADGEIQDARRLVKTQYPDVTEKVKIIGLTDAIPNDPIVFRKDMPEEMVQEVLKAFMAYIKTDEGKDAFHKIYGVTAFQLATDADYDGVREILKTLGKSAAEMVK